MLMPIKVFRTIHAIVKAEITRLNYYSIESKEYSHFNKLVISRDLKKWHRINKEFVNSLKFDAQYSELSDAVRLFLNINLSDADKQRLLALVRADIEYGGIIEEISEYSNRYNILAVYSSLARQFYKHAVKDGTLKGKFSFIGHNMYLNRYRKQLKTVRKVEDAIKFLKKELRPNNPPKQRSISKKVKGFIWDLTH